MDRRTRVCVWIIVGGLINFLLFTLIYIAIGGDARNGYAGRVIRTDQANAGDLGRVHYYVRMRVDDKPTRVAWGWFLYSHIHGVSLWITHAAVLLAMLTLAKDHIINVLSEGFGRAVIHFIVFVVILSVIVMTMIFLLDFRYTRKHPKPVDQNGIILKLEPQAPAPPADPAPPAATQPAAGWTPTPSAGEAPAVKRPAAEPGLVCLKSPTSWAPTG